MDTTPSPKKPRLVVFEEFPDAIKHSCFFDYISITPAYVNDGKSINADQICIDEGFVAGLWRKSVEGEFPEVWRKWVSEITDNDWMKMADVPDENAPVVKGGKRMQKKPSGAVMKKPSAPVSIILTSTQREKMDSFIKVQTAYENSALGQTRDRRRNFVRSRVWVKIKTEMVYLGIDNSDVLSSYTQECLGKIKNIDPDSK